MKVGDKIVCINNINLAYNSKNYNYLNAQYIKFTVNRVYIIKGVGISVFYINNDFNEEVNCQFKQFDRYFMLLKEYRKLKLEKINESK